ncbi:MAG: type II secretion system protein [Synergistaceae bacterium]|nr:type II secretion system protein [Synergistaceae bacterium]
MRKGFTLVEILIVIIVMSILGAMMTYSSSEAISSNKAAEIVVKLRNLKIAAMQMYVDYLDEWESTSPTKTFGIALAKTYLNDDSSYDSKYDLVTADADSGTYAEKRWYAKCDFSTMKDADNIAIKLEKRAETDDLLSNATRENNGKYTETKFTSGYKIVLLRIR